AGLDWESRSRFEDAARRVKRLAGVVERAGGRFLLVDYYTDGLAASRRFFASQLRPEQVCYLTSDLRRAGEGMYKVDTVHWNRAGNELVAKCLYSLIRERGLLPKLGLKEWPEATTLAKEWLPRGDEEAQDEELEVIPPSRRKIAAAIDFSRLDG